MDLESNEAQAAIKGAAADEEKKEDAKKDDGSKPDTCIIEILGVKKLDGNADDAEEKNVACCVDFTYKDKTAKKIDVGRNYVAHFKQWRSLLNSWVNMSAAEI